MVKIRLQRFGTTKKPFYRIVAAEASQKRDGRFLEILGIYDPTKNPIVLDVDKDAAMKWLQSGAQPTDTVKNLLTRNGVIAAYVDSKKK
jgi:small subunit ribosomal protein S16